MKMKALVPILRGLQKEERKVIYISQRGVEVTAIRTCKFSFYDFAVGLKFPERQEFYPTHVRLLIDLFLKRQTSPQNAQELFKAIDQVYNGAGPESFREVFSLDFPMFLDLNEVTLYYSQLLMLEQDFNFLGPESKKKWKYGREFLKGFINWIASGEQDIDQIITRAVRNWPPPSQFIPPHLGRQESTRWR